MERKICETYQKTRKNLLMIHKNFKFEKLHEIGVITLKFCKTVGKSSSLRESRKKFAKLRVEFVNVHRN